MELRVLNYFLVIAREENFTKAAQQLHITQPTLSRQIAQLEDELGVKLFERNNLHITLTEDGMILKRRAHEILKLAEKTKQDFTNKTENLEGLISIGSGEFQSSCLLMDCVSAFRKKYPLVRFEFFSGNTENICDFIEKGLLDIGLISEPVEMRKFDFINMPIDEQWGILIGKESPLVNYEFITPKDIINQPLFLPNGNITESNIGKWFGEYREQMDIVARGNLQYNASLFVERNLGLVVGIKLNYDYKNLHFIPLKPELKHGTALTWKKDETFSIATSVFIEFAKQYFKGIKVNNL